MAVMNSVRCQTDRFIYLHKTYCRVWAALRDIHLDVGEEMQGEVPRAYSVRELSSAPPEMRMQSVWIPFEKNAWIRER